ncbi:MAG: cell division protein FtsA [Candidatus Paceibacterota bacterium]|jgi:cell division protein FtsA
MANKTVVGIDIGTYQIKVVVAESDPTSDSGLHVLGTGLAESKGLHHGYIINPTDVTKSLRKAISQAEKTSNIRIKKAYLSLGGIGLGASVATGAVIISKADSEITDTDMKSVLIAAEEELSQAVITNRKIIHAIPLSYKIDGKAVFGRPVHMKGNRFEVKGLFITYLEQHLNDLVEAVENAGIEVIDVMVAPLAAGLVTLNKTQKIAGCVLANIGSETVSIVVYENNTPISLEVFPIGGNNITNDIALGLRIPLEEAEHIKLGTILGADYPKKKLEEIVVARLGDIFDLIEAHLKKIGRSGLLPAGIVITGGGAGVDAIEEIAKATLKLPSRVALMEFAHNVKVNNMKDASWSVAYGLCVFGLNTGDSEEVGIHLRIQSDVLKKVGGWLKQFLP